MALLFLASALLWQCQSAPPDTDITPVYTLLDSTADTTEPFVVLNPHQYTTGEDTHAEKPDSFSADLPAHLFVALSYAGTTETAHNDSPEIRRFLKAVNLGPGYNYCAAFVRYCLDEAGAVYPGVRSGVAIHYKTPRSIEAREVARTNQELPPGMVAIWQRGNTWQGHTGFITEWAGVTGTTIEANTTPGASANERTGNGVYERSRSIDALAYFRITHFTPVGYE